MAADLHAGFSTITRSKYKSSSSSNGASTFGIDQDKVANLPKQVERVLVDGGGLALLLGAALSHPDRPQVSEVRLAPA